MSLLEKSYSMQAGSPPPMAWDDYDVIVRGAWASILEDGRDASEKEVQTFLEMHPCLLPGPFGPIGGSGHSPYPAAVITQPRLTDFNPLVPDFMWIARDSMTVYPILVEIEAPSKRWFTSKGIQHSDLTQALNQLAQWKAWFSKPRNRDAFVDHYAIDLAHRNLEPKYMLIYGRREEANANPALITLRHALACDDQFIMTFDRLAPQSGAKEFLTVRKAGDGFEALFIPPTLTLGPLLADERASIKLKEQAADASPYFDVERRDFLKRRFSYWDDWHTSGAMRMMSTGDWE